RRPERRRLRHEAVLQSFRPADLDRRAGDVHRRNAFADRPPPAGWRTTARAASSCGRPSRIATHGNVLLFPTPPEPMLGVGSRNCLVAAAFADTRGCSRT